MIVLTDRFQLEIEQILTFIAKDSVSRSFKFRDDVYSKIYNIPRHPLIYRKSFLFDDENIRDLIFNGYVIPFEIKNSEFLILGIYKANKWS